MATKGLTGLSLMVRYWGNENGNRTFDILVDNQIIATENVTGKWKVNKFVNLEYPIPSSILKDKSVITVTFRAKVDNVAGGVFYLRLLKPEIIQSSINLPIQNNKAFIFKRDGTIIIRTQDESSISAISFFTITGQLIQSGTKTGNEVTFGNGNLAKGVYLLQYRSNGKLMSQKILL